MNTLLISPAESNGKGKFQFFNLMTALNKTVTFARRCVRAGLRVNGGEGCHGSLSFYFDTHGQPPWHENHDGLSRFPDFIAFFNLSAATPDQRSLC